MGKINEKTLKEASARLSQALAALVMFDCGSLDCDNCPLQYKARCAATILYEMHTQADKRVKEAAK